MSPIIHTEPIKDWYSGSYPLVVAGPCSAESEKQVVETALALSEIKEVGIFRAGIWKPRSRPSDFQGVGIKGLGWLRKVKKETGLMTAVEIGQADHLKACLDHQIDIIWIGARTVVNPFSMQEIAEALQNTDLPVFIKNPVSPDIKLWVGALERVNQAGISKLVAVHRGFFSPIAKTYRNEPLWEIPIELKRLHPELPIICDPSHISGHRNLIPGVAQQALDIGMDGLMIESHISPEKAQTDIEQQITPGQLKELISQLRTRESKSDASFEHELDALRTAIDQVDADLINTLAKRMDMVDRIGRIKQKHNMTAFQVKRWQEVMDTFLQTGSIAGLEQRFLKELLELIHKESIRIQSNLFSENKDD